MDCPSEGQSYIAKGKPWSSLRRAISITIFIYFLMRQQEKFSEAEELGRQSVFGQLLEIYYREENHRLGATAEVLSCYMN